MIQTMANCCVIFSATTVSLVAILVGLYYNQVIPEGLPGDQQISARLYGVNWDICTFIGYAASLVGFGDSPIENFKRLLHLPKALAEPQIDKSWQFQDGKISNVPVRIYKPRQHDKGKKVTGVVYLHGGGWTIGSVDIFHPLTYQLAKDAGVVLISVDYRLAPKHTFPVQFNDCYAVVNTLLATAEKYGIDKNRIVVAGDSAGGNLAAAIALKLRDENKRLAAQILINPTLQFMDFSLPSMKKQGSAILTRYGLAQFVSYYMTGTPNMTSSFLVNNHSMHLRNTKYSSYIGIDDQAQRKPQQKPLNEIPKAVINGLIDYRASPLMADNMKGLPKTLLITCEYDVLKDDGLLYKARLQSAGVEVTHYNYMTYHAFLLIQKTPFFSTEEFHLAFRDIVDYIRAL